MADTSISRPQAGQHIVLEQAAGNRLIFDFPTDQAMLDKVDNNLVLTFDDGSTVTLQDFYTAYTKDTLPEFVIDGQPVAGEQFFAALGEDLMPAAGPAAGPAVAPGAGSGAAFGAVDFLGGLTRLGGLDIGFPMESDITDTLQAFGGDPEGPANATPLITGFTVPAAGVVEAGVFVGGNEANPGVPSVTGQVLATDPEGDALTYGFMGPDGTLVTSLTTPYGTITMEPGGTYTYTLNNEAANGLAAGDTTSESFTILVTDAAGNTTIAPAPIVVTIQGTNDIPGLSLTVPEIALNENDMAADGGNAVVTGTAVGADVDNGAVLRYDFGSDANGNPITSVTDDYGTLTIDPATGVYTYTLNGSSDAVQSLNADDRIVKNVTVHVTDEHGAHTEQNLNITLQGQNDAPVITTVTSLGVTESGVRDVDGDPNKLFEGKPVDVTGKLTSTDADARDGEGGDRPLSYFLTPKDGETLSVSVNAQGQTIHTLTNAYGVLELNTATGDYGFTLLNGNSAVQGLVQDQKLDLGFTVGVSDQQGGTGNAQINVTITGTNDQPAITVSDKALGIDEGEQSVSGDFITRDVDNDGSIQTLSIASGSDLTTGTANNPGQPGQTASFTTDYGTFTVDPATGKYTFTLNNEKGGAADKLAQGQPHTETFTITTTDAHGATSEQTITVTIMGTNDDPVLKPNPDQMLSVTEAGVINGTNTETPGHQYDSRFASAEDMDGDKLTYFFIAPDGSHVSQLYVIEDPSAPLGYHFSTERDWFTQNHLGTVMLDPVTGKYAFHLNNMNATINGMNPDSPDMVLTGFTMYVKDANGGISDTVQNYGVTIKGTNDRPEITLSKQYFAFTEDAPEAEQSLSGEWKVIDKDSDGSEQTLSIARLHDKTGTSSEDSDGNVSFTTPSGTLTVRPDGTYTFTLDNDDKGIQGLRDGEVHHEVFTITTTDKWGATHSQDIRVDFIGVNDKPVLTPKADQVLTVTEKGVLIGGNTGTNGTPTASETANGFDIDSNDRLTYFFITADGKELSTVYVMRDASSPDGYTLVSARPSNTNPDFLGTLTASTKTDNTGSYSFTLNNDSPFINGLNPDSPDIQLEDLTVHVKDQSGTKADADQSFDVVIKGTNDQPTLKFTQGNGRHDVVDATNIATATEPSHFEKMAGGTLLAADGDSGDTKTYTIVYGGKTYTVSPDQQADGLTINTTYGKLVFSFGADGKVSYEFHVNNGYEGKIHELAEGVTAAESFKITVTDTWGANATQNVTVTLKGDNDPPWVGPNDEGSWHDVVVEDAGLDRHEGDAGFEHTISKSGQLEAADAEGDKLSFALVTAEGGTNLLRTLPHIVKDDNGVEHEIGYITLKPDGSYTYTLFNDNAYVQQMGANHPGFEASFWVRVTDGKGGVTYKEMTINVKGANDAPHISGGNNNVQEDGGLVQPDADTKLSVNGKVSASDIDNGEAASGNMRFELTGAHVQTAVENGITVTRVEGQYGTLTLRPDGSYTYELFKQTNDGMQGTHKDDLFAKESFDFKVTTGLDQGEGNSDGNTVAGGKINVSITGTNDAPQIDTDVNGDAEITAPGLTKVTVTGTVTADDIDESVAQGNDRDDLIFRVMQKYDKSDAPEDTKFTDTTGQEKHPDLTWQAEQTVKGDYGSLTIHPDGSYTYTLDVFNPAVKNAPVGTVFTETSFRVTVTDHHGATHTVDLPITIQKPELAGNGQGGGTTPDPNIFIADVDASADIKVTEDQMVDGKFISRGEVDVTFGCKHSGHDQGNEHGNDVPVFFAFKLPSGEYTQTLSDKFGSVTIDPLTGDYIYTLNNDSRYVQELPEGYKLQLPGFEVHVLDANGNPMKTENGGFATTTIGGTVTGINDAPIIDTVDGIVVADGGITSVQNNRVTGHDTDKDLLDRDEDGNTTEQEPLRYTFTYYGLQIRPGETMEMAYGTFSLKPDGTYSYTLREGSKDLEALAGGKTVNDAGLKVTVSDGINAVERDIPVMVTGKNDTPTLSFADAQGNLVFAEDSGIAQLSGKALGDDVDRGDTLRYSMELEGGGKSAYLLTGKYGTMVLDPVNGDYKYLLDNERPAVQSIGSGETTTEVFWITVTDQHGASHRESITVTINGTDDRAEVKLTQTTTSITENDTNHGTPVQLGIIDVKDIDVNDHQTLSLKNGEDGEITWKGTGSVDVAGKYGTLTLNADGTYSYTLTSHALAQGAKYTESFTILVKEYDSKGNYLGESEHDVKVNLTGTNDAPSITGGLVTEGLDAGDSAHLAFTGKAIGFDPDVTGTGPDGDIHQNVSFTFTYNGVALKAGQPYEAAYGTILVAADGTYTYTVDPDKAATFNLADGQIVVDNGLSVKAADGSASSAAQGIEFSITGTNDAPVITGGISHDFGSVEDGSLIFTGHVLATDTDGIGTEGGAVIHSDLVYSFTYDSQPLIPGQEYDVKFGTLTVYDDGTYTYTVNPDLDAVKALHGETGTDTLLGVNVSDSLLSTDQGITITLTGANEAPEINAITSQPEPTEDGALVFSGHVTASDPDGDHLSYAITDGGQYGHLSINEHGEFTYNVETPPVNGETGDVLGSFTESITVDVTDSHGETTSVTFEGVFSVDSDAAVTYEPSTDSSIWYAPETTPDDQLQAFANNLSQTDHTV